MVFVQPGINGLSCRYLAGSEGLVQSTVLSFLTPLLPNHPINGHVARFPLEFSGHSKALATVKGGNRGLFADQFAIVCN